jgi:hypothetical protein
MVGADPILRIVIDADGRIWSPAAAEFHRHLGYPEPDFDLARYAVRNLGYVLLELSAAPDGLLIIEFRVILVKPRALLEAARFIESKAADSPLKLRYLLADWTEESFQSAAAAIVRIEELLGSGVLDRRMHVLSQRLELDHLIEASAHRLRPLFQLWRASFGNFTDTTLPFLVQHGYDERMVIAERCPGSDAHSFRYVGAGLSFYDDAERLRMIGTDLREQPDRAYGEWVARAYSEASSTMQPVFERVDAVIRPPGRQPRRSQYERLLLPFNTPERNILVIGSSVLDQEPAEPVSATGSR